MPRYDVKCTNKECDFKETKILSFQQLDDMLSHGICPKCQSKIERDWTDNGLNFKLNGSGWAKDGYKK